MARSDCIPENDYLRNCQKIRVNFIIKIALSKKFYNSYFCQNIKSQK